MKAILLLASALLIADISVHLSAGSSTPPPAEASSTYLPESGQMQYEVRPGDTLRSIALDLYGDPAKWKTLYDRNRDLIPLRGGELIPGQKPRVPPAGPAR